MALLKFASGVKVSPQTIIAVAFLNAANELGFSDRVCTSGNDHVHMPGSLHFSDRALDFRTRDLSTTQKHQLRATAKRRLGKHYDVLLEDENGPNEHLHIEFDPA
ncbi:MAG: hypothetical protein ABMA15_17470 [Vicinamibacterales bacterium]